MLELSRGWPWLYFYKVIFPEYFYEVIDQVRSISAECIARTSFYQVCFLMKGNRQYILF